jgi:hypothetical protein
MSIQPELAQETAGLRIVRGKPMHSAWCIDAVTLTASMFSDDFLNLSQKIRDENRAEFIREFILLLF